MNLIDSRIGKWLVWILPFAVIAVLIGWETEWGQALKRVPALDEDIKPQAVAAVVLPEYRIDGGISGNRETVERTLFNPTRRPAPPSVAAAAKPALQKGQFVLTGTTVIEKKATAFLREVNGGKSRRVQQGESINGMLVAEVRADRVKFTLGDDAEELTLKVASGPRTTVQPVAPPASPGQPGGPVGPAAVPPPQGGSQGVVQDAADVLANRRRAIRAAETAAQTQPAAAPAAMPVTTPAAGSTAAPASATAADPHWNEIYQRMQQQRVPQSRN